MLSNAYFLAKFRFDTAENEPVKNLQNFAKFAKFANFANPSKSKLAKTDCVDHERDNADQSTLENARTICVAPEVSNLFAALSKFISSHFLFLLSFSQRWTGLNRENSRNDRAFSISFASCPLLLRVSLCLHKTWMGYSRPLPYKAFPKPHQQQQKRISVWCDQSCSAQKTILSLVHWKPQPRALLTP